MPGKVSKHTNLIGFGSETFIASVTVKARALQMSKIERLVPVIRSSAAPAAHVAYTVVISAKKDTATIYAWKHTSVSNPTLIAATVAGTCDYVVVGE